MADDKTLFEKILDGDIPGEIIHQDELCGAFHDISPKAPVHVLIVPRKPIPGVADVVPEDAPTLGHMMVIARKLAEDLGLEAGYRLVVNCGEHGQQTVPHLHIHLLGGRQLQWPPG